MLCITYVRCAYKWCALYWKMLCNIVVPHSRLFICPGALDQLFARCDATNGLYRSNIEAILHEGEYITIIMETQLLSYLLPYYGCV